jgi:hypothetical protein
MQVTRGFVRGAAARPAEFPIESPLSLRCDVVIYTLPFEPLR